MLRIRSCGKNPAPRYPILDFPRVPRGHEGVVEVRMRDATEEIDQLGHFRTVNTELGA
jgi:hypothetical protein